jgi:hypothetical protein
MFRTYRLLVEMQILERAADRPQTFFQNPVAVLVETSENIELMQLPTTPRETFETPIPTGKIEAVTEPSSESRSKSIVELAGHPDFPKCALGVLVDIGGYTGVVVEIVKQSIKVKSPEGSIQSFNFNWLRKLYAPMIQPAANEMSTREEPPAPVEKKAEPPSPAPRRDVITEPNFNRDVKGISVFAVRSDFPKCAFGEFVDIGGYTGVVVEIVNRSLKVRSPEGILRSYNADILRKLYGQ